MNLTSLGRIQQRVRGAQSHELWKRKVHHLRAIVLGDLSSIDAESSPQVDPEGENKKRARNHNISGLYDLLTRDFEEGTSNKLMDTIKTLIMESSFKFPDIDFDGVDPLESTINSLYLSKRFAWAPGGCAAEHHMKIALLDYLIGGLGWVWTGLDRGRPIVEHVDSIDVFYDTDAKLIPGIKYAGCFVEQRLFDWIQIYGVEPFRDLLEKDKRDGDLSLDSVVQLCYYWDTEGDFGTHAVLRMTGLYAVDIEKPVVHEENPHYIKSEIIEVPYLPLEPVYFLKMPSARNPVSQLELMLPSQMAVRDAERTARRIIKSGASYFDVEDGAYEADQLENLESGEEGAIVIRNPNKQAAIRVEPADIPSGLMAYLDYHDRKCQVAGGANPYAGGQGVEGVDLATEVRAINNSSGLTASSITSDHASHWARVASKCLANGAIYDEVPTTLRYGQLILEFGPQNPIGQYLRPDATPIVSEDSLRYQSREARIAQATAKFNQALSVAAYFPATLQIAYEDLLMAYGDKDVQRHFAMPAQVAENSTSEQSGPNTQALAV